MVSGEEERACFAASGESKMARIGRVGALEVFVVSYYFVPGQIGERSWG